jgi:hypothetical protein
MYYPVIHKTSCILAFNLLNLGVQKATNFKSQCLSFPIWICFSMCKYLHWFHITWYLITVSNQNERLVFLHIRYGNIRRVTRYKYMRKIKQWLYCLLFWRLRNVNFGLKNSLSMRVGKIVKSDYALRNVCRSVLPHGTIRLPLGKFSWNLLFEYFSKIWKLKCHWNLTSITGTLHNNQVTFLIISGSLLLRMRNV